MKLFMGQERRRRMPKIIISTDDGEVVEILEKVTDVRNHPAAQDDLMLDITNAIVKALAIEIGN